MSAYTWLINHLSQEQDTVADIGGSSGLGFAAALREGRHALWVTSCNDTNVDAEIIGMIEQKRAELQNDDSEGEELVSEDEGDS